MYMYMWCTCKWMYMCLLSVSKGISLPKGRNEVRIIWGNPLNTPHPTIITLSMYMYLKCCEVTGKSMDNQYHVPASNRSIVISQLTTHTFQLKCMCKLHLLRSKVHY